MMQSPLTCRTAVALCLTFRRHPAAAPELELPGWEQALVATKQELQQNFAEVQHNIADMEEQPEEVAAALRGTLFVCKWGGARSSLLHADQPPCVTQLVGMCMAAVCIVACMQSGAAL